MKSSIFKTAYIIAVIVSLSGCSQGAKEISVKGADGKEYTSYQSACSNGDFDAARTYIGKMKEQRTVIDDYYARERLDKAISEAEDYIFNEEIQYLASLNEEQANNRLVLILNQQSVEGLEAPEGACLGKHVSDFDLEHYESGYDNLDDSPAEVKSFRKYISWCGNHNSRCNTLFGIAIACGNESLAKKIIHLLRKDPELLLKNERKEKNHDNRIYYDVYAHYTNASRDAAQQKYDEAVKSGAFN